MITLLFVEYLKIITDILFVCAVRKKHSMGSKATYCNIQRYLGEVKNVFRRKQETKNLSVNKDLSVFMLPPSGLSGHLPPLRWAGISMWHRNFPCHHLWGKGIEG